jgi:hypothetical protein
MGCNQSTEIHKTKDIVTISGKNPLNTLDDYNEILLLTQIARRRFQKFNSIKYIESIKIVRLISPPRDANFPH